MTVRLGIRVALLLDAISARPKESAMAASTVRRRGTDSSGRGIFATDKMWSWWLDTTKALGFTPVITQGAHMRLAGGGAKDSAGYHDGGGTFDLRVWNLTDEQVAKTVRTLRRHGAAAWLRNEERGGFTDPHIHFVLGSDSGLSSGARSQWASYVAGRDGLASNGVDYHWRPSPLVLKPPQKLTIPPRVTAAIARLRERRAKINARLKRLRGIKPR